MIISELDGRSSLLYLILYLAASDKSLELLISGAYIGEFAFLYLTYSLIVRVEPCFPLYYRESIWESRVEA